MITTQRCQSLSGQINKWLQTDNQSGISEGLMFVIQRLQLLYKGLLTPYMKPEKSKKPPTEFWLCCTLSLYSVRVARQLLDTIRRVDSNRLLHTASTTSYLDTETIKFIQELAHQNETLMSILRIEDMDVKDYNVSARMLRLDGLLFVCEKGLELFFMKSCIASNAKTVYGDEVRCLLLGGGSRTNARLWRWMQNMRPSSIPFVVNRRNCECKHMTIDSYNQKTAAQRGTNDIGVKPLDGYNPSIMSFIRRKNTWLLSGEANNFPEYESMVNATLPLLIEMYHINKPIVEHTQKRSRSIFDHLIAWMRSNKEHSENKANTSKTIKNTSSVNDIVSCVLSVMHLFL